MVGVGLLRGADQAQNLLWERRRFTRRGRAQRHQTQGIRLTAVQSSGGPKPLPPGVYAGGTRPLAMATATTGWAFVRAARP